MCGGLNNDAKYFPRNFGLDGDTLKRILEQGMEKGGDFAEVFCQHSANDTIGFEDGQVNRAETQVDLGVGVRVLKGDQTGYAYTEDLSLEAILRAAKTAATIADSSPGEVSGSWLRNRKPVLYTEERVWRGVSPEKKLSIVQSVGEKLISLDSDVIKVNVIFADADDVILVANSEGTLVEDTRPMTYMYAVCVAERKGRIETNTYSVSRRQGVDFYDEQQIDTIAKTALKRTLALFDASPPPAGEMPVVLAPATSGILLHEAMGHGFEADFNRKKVSIFSSMMGKKVAEDFVTITDSALEHGSRGAIHVDDEGVAGQRTVLVENGKLVSYMHDRLSAKHFGLEPTGNGRRQSFRHIPLPRMRVTAMENGPHDPEEIIKSVKKGLYAVDFANGEVAIGAGDYSFYVKSGFLIEDGKLTRPIKDANLIGNGPDSLSKVTMVGNDKKLDAGTWTCGKEGQGVPVGLGMPTVKVSSITVGGVNR